MKKKGEFVKRNFVILLSLFSFALLLRSPFFFDDVIDWDESTFILMGQSIIDGHLPYTQIWDNKPPLLFAIFALFIKLFGHSIVGIRLAGTSCVTLNAFLLYLTVHHGWSRKVSITMSFLSIYIMTLLPSGQATLSEHLALLPLITVFYLLTIQNSRKAITYLIVGFLLGCATLIRLNLVYVFLILGIWFLISHLKQKESFRSILKNACAYVLGYITVFFFVCIPYLYAGETPELWKSAVLAPLNYSNSGYSVINSILQLVADPIGIFAFVATLLAIYHSFKNWHILSPSQQNIYQLSLVLYTSILFSIVKSGGGYLHYLIQVAPFFALIPLLALDTPLDWKRLKKTILVLMIGILIAGLFKVYSPIRGYSNLFARSIQGQSIWTGSAYAIAEYIHQQNHDAPTMFVLSQHIIYWLVGTMPLSKCSTHPSNLFRASLLPYCGIDGNNSTSEAELNYILQQNPDYILTNQWYLNRYLKKGTAVNSIFQNNLASKYKLVFVIDEDKLYARQK